MKLTDAQQKMLGILAAQKRPCGPQYLGEQMWPHRYRGSNCSAPYARPAGKLLNALKRLELAEHVHQGDLWWGWQITPAGRRALAPAASDAASDTCSRCDGTRIDHLRLM